MKRKKVSDIEFQKKICREILSFFPFDHSSLSGFRLREIRFVSNNKKIILTNKKR